MLDDEPKAVNPVAGPRVIEPKASTVSMSTGQFSTSKSPDVRPGIDFSNLPRATVLDNASAASESLSLTKAEIKPVQISYKKAGAYAGVSVLLVMFLAAGSVLWNSRGTNLNNTKQAADSIAAQQAQGNSLQTSLDTATIKLNRDTVSNKKFTAKGQVAIQNEADSNAAFLIQDAKSNNLFVVDTINKRVGVGEQPSGTAALQVAGDISTNGHIIAGNGDISLSSEGLRIGSTLVCSARGCISSSSPSPTPTSPTIDVANVAFINSSQIYTGANKFTNIGNTFSGDGSGLSNVDAASLGGNTAGFYTNAANISSGTLSDTRLSGNVALRNSDQTFTGTNVFKSSVNSLAAFQLQDSTGASNLLIGDTLNNRIAIAKSTASYTLDVGGSINGVTVYQNGNQVCDASGNCTTSSTSLSDSANIARLNANQTFTGNNTFTGTVLSKNSSDSNAALQIQNSTGATQFNVNTADGYIINNGTASFSSLLQNPGFEASGGGGVSGWNFADGAAIANDSANAHSGNNEVVIPAGLSSTTPVVTTQLYSVTPGDQLNAQVWVKNAAGTNGSSSVAICYYDKNKTPTFCSLQNFSAPGTSYVLKQNLSTVPAGQTYASMGVGYTTTSTVGTWYFDDAFFADNVNRSYAIFQNSINSTNAFQVQNSSGVSLVNVDTANGKVTLNSQSTNNANAFSVIDSFSHNILNVDTVNNSGQVSIRLGANPGAALAVGSDSVGLDLFKVVDQTASSSTVFDIADEGAAIFKNRTDSTAAFQIQNAAGTSNLLVADTTHTRLAVGQASASYTLDVAGDINSTTGIRVGGSLLCDTSGCLAAAGSGSYIQNNTAAQSGNFYVKSANGANPAGVVEGASSQSSDIFQVKADSVSNPLLSVGNTGATTLRNSSNSTSAFVVQNASASPVFNIDTTNSRIGINTSTPTESLTIAYGNEAFINDPDPVTAPVATVNPAAGNLNGTYIYVVTFITPSGETAPSPGSNAPAPINQQVDLSSIPTGGPRVLARKIYRVKLVGGSPPWNLVATINDNVTTTYTDNLADGSVGAGATFINSTGGTITLNGVRVLVASQTTSVGYQAGVNNIGNENSFFGYQAGQSNTSGGGNTAMGYQALQANTTGALNLAIGALSLQVNTTGSNNTATGFGALARNTTGSNNVSVGTDSLNANTTGGDNIGIGAFALAGNTTGISNIGIGSSALLQATTGQYNTAVGTGAAQRITTGGKNTGMGYIALNRITTGTGNTAIGYDALDSVTTGTNNTALGYLANVSSSNLTNATAIGANAVVSASNSLVLGGTGANAVKVGIGTATPGSVLDVRGDANFKNLTDSTTAFQVQNASGGSLINVDSSGSKITLNGLLSGELGAWRTASTSIPAARTAHSSVVANGYVYVLGGSNSSAVYYAKLNADGSTGAWVTSTNPLPVGISYQSSVVYGGYVYVIGGVTGGGAQSTVYYAKLNADGSTGAWVTSTNPLPAVRYRQGSVVANGYVYAFGGDNGSTAQSTVYYAKLNADGSTGAWVTSTNPLPQTIQDVSATVANGYAYIVGGYNAGTLSTIYYAKLNADGSTSGWTASANSLPQGMEDVRTVTSNGYIYALAGDPTAGGSSTTSIYYSPLNSATGDVGVWQTNVSLLPSYLQTPATAVTSNGYIYLVGANSINAPVTYYASTSRVQIGANLDLVGLQAGTLADGGNIGQGSIGGSITAGNITAIGSLQVQGSGTFVQGLSSSGNLSVNGYALFQNSVNSTTALQVQNAAGNLVIQTDTTNSRLAVGNIFESPTSTFEVEGPLQDAANGLAFNIKSFDTSSAAQNVGGGIGFGGYADTTRMFGAIQGYHESVTASDYSGGLRFFTRQNGSGSLSQIMNLASNGAATFQNSVNSATAFQIQNATSVSEVVVDTVNDRIAIGASAVPANGILTIGTDTNSSSQGVYFGTDTNLYRRSSGQLNTDGSLSVGTNLGVGNCGVTSAKLCVGPTALIGAIINENGTSDILNLQNAGTNVVTVDAYGHAVFKNAATYDSATAFQIQNSSSVSLFTVDTSNSQITLGVPSATPVLLVLGNKNTTGDPSCTNGAIYYNSNSNQFRGCASGTWTSFGNFHPSTRVYDSTTQSVPSATSTAFTFDTERWDSSNLHDTVTNPSRITITSPGKYHITGNIEWPTAGGSRRIILIRLNGTTIIAQTETDLPASQTITQNISTDWNFAANDYVEILGYQDSGGPLTIAASTGYQAEFSATWDSE
jgi:hypothetical protein